MHTIILGKFGSGKSNYGTHLVVEEVLHTTRPIVTTLALDLPRLNEYIQQLDPNHDHKVWQRVLILTKEQLPKFWRYRGVAQMGEYGQDPITWGPCGDHAKDGKEDPIWHAVHQGVVYHLDEAPVGFHSRRWQNTGTEFSDYITQHRKIGDDVYSYARHSNLLDKQFRDTADRCIIMDNWYQKAVRIFTMPKKLVVTTYENCPPAPNEDPVQKTALKIDPVGLSSCYFTAKGLGVAGTGLADTQKRARGIPWWTVLPIGIVTGLVAWYGVSKLTGFTVRKGTQAMTLNATPTGATPPKITPPPTNAPPVLAPAPAQFTLPPITTPAKPWSPPYRKCKGWAITGDKLYITTDNGIYQPLSWETHPDGMLADRIIWTRSDPPADSRLILPLR